MVRYSLRTVFTAHDHLVDLSETGKDSAKSFPP